MKLALGLMLIVAAQGQTLRLHPANPHYFEYKGKPLALITSAEHYGAVINQGFDYRKYLAALERDGMNYTRVFTGSYSEIPGSFGIKRNTLAPKPEDRLLPWKQTGGKWDLEQWEPRYFERLHAFVEEAARRGVIVEVTLFSSYYTEAHWKNSPFHPSNNADGTPEIDWKKLHTLDNGGLTRYQEALVRKLAAELNRHDNVFFEIQNEPWSDQTVVAGHINAMLPEPARSRYPNSVDVASEASLEWQARVAEWIRSTEAVLPKKHLIAQNACNFRYPIRGVAPGVSIVNFHYAYPEAALWNQGLNLVVGDDETGFKGRDDRPYRLEAWRFLLAGGGLFNHLDYSFSEGKEDGTDSEPNGPGGGSTALRRQIAVLGRFFHSLPFVEMRPDPNVVLHTPGLEAQAFSKPGEVYAIHLTGSAPAQVRLALPKGRFAAEWIDTKTGATLKREEFLVRVGGPWTLEGPPFDEDIAVKVSATR